jgi:hypothetical protein
MSLTVGKILLKMLLQISHVQCLKHPKMSFGVPDTWYAIYLAVPTNLYIGMGASFELSYPFLLTKMFLLLFMLSGSS